MTPSAQAKKKTASKKKASKKAASKKASAQEPRSKKKPTGPRLFVVKPGKTVFWPLPGFPFRCATGAIISGEDPFVRVKKYPDQAYKLRPVTDKEIEQGFVQVTYDDRDEGRVTKRFPIRITPCQNRRMHKEYKDRGIDWMPLELRQPEERSVIQPEAQADGQKVVDNLDVGDDFTIPDVDPADVEAFRDLDNDPVVPPVDGEKDASSDFDEGPIDTPPADDLGFGESAPPKVEG